LIQFFLFKFALVLNSALLFWKLLVFGFLLGRSETLLCSMSAPHVKIVPLLDVHQLLMLSLGTLTYSEPRTFFLIIFYNVIIIIIIIIITCIYVCLYEYYSFSPHNGITIASVLLSLC
jgi:hypothetical protein